MSAPESTIQKFVAAFVTAWPERDAAKVMSFFAEDAIYQNMPSEPIKGRQAIEAAMATMMDLGGRVEVAITHLLAEGSVIMTRARRPIHHAR